jgi:hypothetical protein
MDSETNIESEIILLVSENEPITATELVKLLQDRYKTKTGVELGYSSKNLYKRIRRLRTNGTLSSVREEDIRLFGIPKVDRRSDYLVLAVSDERRTHIDGVLQSLDSGNQLEIDLALNEILLYKKNYHLNSSQLDSIVSLLTNKAEIVDLALQILKEYIIDRKIEPLNKDRIIKNLRNVLQKYRDDKLNRILIDRAVHLLAHYQDDAIIDQLEHDAELIVDNWDWRNLYCTPEVGIVVEKNRKRLFDFEKELNKQGKRNVAKAIHYIRIFAVDPDSLRLPGGFI